MTLTRISAVTGLLALIVQVVVGLGWWGLSQDQQALLTGAILTAGGLVHSFFNPNIQIGKT